MQDICQCDNTNKDYSVTINGTKALPIDGFGEERRGYYISYDCMGEIGAVNFNVIEPEVGSSPIFKGYAEKSCSEIEHALAKNSDNHAHCSQHCRHNERLQAPKKAQITLLFFIFHKKISFPHKHMAGKKDF